MMSDVVSKQSTVQGFRSEHGGKKRPLESEDVSMSAGSSNKNHLDPETWHQQRRIKTQKAEAQIAAYALELVESTPATRLHTIGVFLCDDKVSYWYIDSSGVVRTSPESTLSIIFDFEKVVAIHLALSYCGPEQLGAFPPSIICPPVSNPFPGSLPSHSLTGFTIDLSGEKDQMLYKVTLGKQMVSQYALIGRRTTVYHASSTSDDTGGRALVVKLSQHICMRTSEVELLEHAYQCGVKAHLPEIVKAKDLWWLSKGIRRSFNLNQDDWENRVLRCLLLPYYLPIHDRLRENPDCIKIMAKQMLKCA